MACRRQLGLEPKRRNEVRDGVRFGPCPLTGKRAVELVRGDALRFFEDFGARVHMHIMRYTARLSVEDMSIVMNDYNRPRTTCCRSRP